MLFHINEEENLDRMQRGELYYAFTPQLAARTSITDDDRPLPPPAASEDEDDVVLHEYPWVVRPIRMDYGTNVKVGSNVFINSNCTIIDTRTVTIGSRTLFGPNVSLYSGAHPLDPELRDGTNGPESGAPITIGEDCWLGGNVVVLPGVTIGKGSTVGAGSVVTKDVPPYHVVAGNPARILRKLEPKSREESQKADKPEAA
ncbi:hypothetical protein ACJZ2D_013109 [Fusarium nematophilum]